MRWAELDWSEEVWRIPSARTKTQTAQELPLSPQALIILESLPRLQSDLVFPARARDAPISGWSKWKNELDEASGVQGWRVHDIRRTVATGMAGIKVNHLIIERVLNHKIGGIAAIYNRFAYTDEKRAALECWAQRVSEVCGCFEGKNYGNAQDHQTAPH